MSPDSRPSPHRVHRVRRTTAVALLLATLVLAGCDAIRGTPPPAKPGDFGELRLALSQVGVHAADMVAGDDGCDDPTLAATAFAFDASGAGVASPILLRAYLFRDDAAYERRRADVDACVAEWATDPASFEFADAPPFVIAGQGPWPAEFKEALRTALDETNGD